MLDPKLRRIIQMLVLAAAAFAKIAAGRRDALRGRLEHLSNRARANRFLTSVQLRLHHFARGHKRHEDHEVV